MLMLVLIELLFVLFLCGIGGTIVGLPIGLLARNRRTVVLLGILFGSVGGLILFIFFYRIILVDYLRDNYSKNPNEFGMGGFADQTAYYITWGCMLVAGAIMGLAGSLLGLALPKPSNKN